MASGDVWCVYVPKPPEYLYAYSSPDGPTEYQIPWKPSAVGSTFASPASAKKPMVAMATQSAVTWRSPLWSMSCSFTFIRATGNSAAAANDESTKEPTSAGGSAECQKNTNDDGNP